MATLAVATKLMPGFGEQMRQISLAFVPTAILSRQVGVIRERDDGTGCLIINLPGQPKAIRETLEGARNADGSLDIWLAHEQPSDERARANWLPAPAGVFRVTLRAYLPRVELREGRAPMPTVMRAPV